MQQNPASQSQDMDALAASLCETFEVLSVLGGGAMGTVYKARHRIMDRDCALKVLHAELASDSRAVKRFQQEALALSRLNHPNIATLHTCGATADDKQVYLDMELLEGSSLRDLLQNGPVPASRAIPWFLQICSALACAHENGIVHRDLKPANIIILPGEVEVVKVVDFGIAKLLPRNGENSCQNLTQTGTLLGSPTYMSPEQCKGAELDMRADIYSLGCLMYEVINGTPPFVGETPFAVMSAHLNDEPPTLPAVSTGAPRELTAVILQCLQKDPASRWPNMTALSQAMEKIDPQLTATRASTSRQRMHILATAFILCGLLAVPLVLNRCNPASSAHSTFKEIISDESGSGQDAATLFKAGFKYLREVPPKDSKASNRFDAAVRAASKSRDWPLMFAAVCMSADYPRTELGGGRRRGVTEEKATDAANTLNTYAESNTQIITDGAELLGREDPALAAAVYKVLGRIKADLKKDDEAFQFYHRALIGCPEFACCKKFLSDLSREYVGLLLRRGRVKEAATLTAIIEERMSNNTHFRGHPAKVGNVQQVIGETYAKQGYEREALKWFTRASANIHKATPGQEKEDGEHHLHLTVSIASKMCKILNKFGRQAEAAKISKEVEDKLRHRAPSELLAHPLELGDYFSSQGEFDKALAEYIAVEGLAQRQGEDPGVGNALRAQAACWLSKRNIPKAHSLADGAVKMLLVLKSDKKHCFELAAAYTVRGQVAFLEGNLKEAIKWYRESSDLYEASGYKDQVAEMRNCVRDCVTALPKVTGLHKM